MDAVIKVGGSLASNPKVLRALCKTLGGLAEQHRIVVVPGGGEFADLIRDLDKRYFLNPNTAHRIAILGMDQYGFLLSQLIPNSLIVQTLVDASDVVQTTKIAVFIPYKLISESAPLEASWDVTSDSIAAHVAIELHARKLVLVTDVDGIYTDNPKTNPKAQLIREISTSYLREQRERTSVDKFLPRLLEKTNIDCFVANGKYPERIEKILENKQTTSTRIISE